MTNIAFSSFSLQSFDGTRGIITESIEHAGKSAKRAQMYALAHANASIIPFVEYPNKPIQVDGVIIGTTIADCDAQIDLFNSYLLAQNGNLDIDYNGSTRRYIATATNIDVNRPGGLAWASFSVTFTCTQPFGQDVAATTLLSPAATRHNLCANPSFETDLTGWSTYSSAIISRFLGDGTYAVNGVAATNVTAVESGLNFTATGNVGVPYINLGTSITYAMWVNPAVTTSLDVISYMSSLIRISSTGISWFPDVTLSPTTFSTTMAANTWYHIVITQTGTTATAYINGASLGSQTVLGPVNTTSNNQTIGSYAASNNFNGKMDDIQLWSRVLSAAEVSNLYNKQAASAVGLQIQYYCSDGSGTTVTDFSGNARNGTISGTVGWTASGITPAIASMRVLSSSTVGGGGFAGGASISVSGLTAGSTYTASAYIKGATGGGSQAGNIYYTDGGNTSVAYTVTTSWQRVSVTFTATATSGTLYIRTSDTNYTLLVDAVQVEQATTVGSYFDGSFPANNTYTYTWSGTVNDSTSTAAGNRQKASYTDNFTFGGTAPFQLPIITVTYSAIGSAPVLGMVSIGNDSTGQQINVLRTWSATDVLVVDCKQNTVTANGVAASFTGAFPAFSVGSGTLDYLDNFASRTFTISAVCYRQYL